MYQPRDGGINAKTAGMRSRIKPGDARTAEKSTTETHHVEHHLENENTGVTELWEGEWRPGRRAREGLLNQVMQSIPCVSRIGCDLSGERGTIGRCKLVAEATEREKERLSLRVSPVEDHDRRLCHYVSTSARNSAELSVRLVTTNNRSHRYLYVCIYLYLY